jgi:hypothetical protein
MLSPTEVTADTKPRDIFESRTCSRCGGSGQMPYRHVMGGRCFKCGGSGSLLTKRGAATQAYFRSLSMLSAEHLQPGDVVYSEPMVAGSQVFSRGGWMTVESVEDNRVRRSSGRIFRLSQKREIAEARERGAFVSEVKPYSFGLRTDDYRREVLEGPSEGCVTVYEGLVVSLAPRRKGQDPTTVHADVARPSFMVSDAATKVARMKSAASFQEMLTKSGTVRKAARVAA